MDKTQKTTGSLKVIAVLKSPHKLPLNALEEYVQKHTDAFLREIGVHCGKDAMARALKNRIK